MPIDQNVRLNQDNETAGWKRHNHQQFLHNPKLKNLPFKVTVSRNTYDTTYTTKTDSRRWEEDGQFYNDYRVVLCIFYADIYFIACDAAAHKDLSVEFTYPMNTKSFPVHFTQRQNKTT